MQVKARTKNAGRQSYSSFFDQNLYPTKENGCGGLR